MPEIGQAFFDEAEVASAASCNIGGTDEIFVEVTGSTGPITAFTNMTGKFRFVRFTGTPTLTHNASIKLPGAANIIVAADARAVIWGDETGICYVLFQRADGKAVIGPASTDITDSTATGRSIVTAANAAAVRTAAALGTAATQNTGTSGTNVPLLDGTNTWANTQTFTVAPVFTAQSGSRTALGLGTAATQNTSTSGANVPLMNGVNTWSSTQTFSGGFTTTGGTMTAAGNFQFNNATNDAAFIITNAGGAGANRSSINTTWSPSADNTHALGTASFRWSQLFAGTTVINTSDEDEKVEEEDQPQAFYDAILSVPLKWYRWKDAIALKGDDARLHYGPMAQDVWRALEASKFDPTRYGMCCRDQWVVSVPRKITVEVAPAEFSKPRGKRKAKLLQAAVTRESTVLVDEPVFEDDEQTRPVWIYGLRLDQFDRARTEAMRRLLLQSPRS